MKPMSPNEARRAIGLPPVSYAAFIPVTEELLGRPRLREYRILASEFLFLLRATAVYAMRKVRGR